MLNSTNHRMKTGTITLPLDLRILGITMLLMGLCVGCTSLAKAIPLLRMKDRTYEISSKNDGLYWSACSKKTLFNPCKERYEDKVLFTNKVRMKEFKSMGFKLIRRKDL